MNCDGERQQYSLKSQVTASEKKGLPSLQNDRKNYFMQLNSEISDCHNFTASGVKLMVDVICKIACNQRRL